jgi:hypothetical protein
MLASVAQNGFAGPPFFTDDPSPVDYHHWEFYIASEQDHLQHEINATLPHLEINYGIFRNVQFHLVAPMEYIRTDDGTTYGYSNTEIGVKYRFVDESDSFPQIGIFPLAEIPTGSKEKQLSNGRIQAYLPLWLQKSWGKLTTYGGGGFWYNPGSDTKNWMFAGWQAQYDFSETVTLGGEIYYHTADQIDSESCAAFDVGGFINIDEGNHVLFSAGHSFLGRVTTTIYLGYQLTI